MRRSKSGWDGGRQAGTDKVTLKLALQLRGQIPRFGVESNPEVRVPELNARNVGLSEKETSDLYHAGA